MPIFPNKMHNQYPRTQIKVHSGNFLNEHTNEKYHRPNPEVEMQ